MRQCIIYIAVKRTQLYLEGWQWNGIVTAQVGFPITPLIGFNNSGTGDGGVIDVPNLNPDFKGPVILGTVEHWFDPRAFSMPMAGTFGGVGRSSFRGRASSTSTLPSLRGSESGRA